MLSLSRNGREREHADHRRRDEEGRQTHENTPGERKAGWHDAWRHVEKRTLPPSQAVKVTPTDLDGRFRITGAGAERLVILEVKAPAMAHATLYIVNRAGFDARPCNQAADSLRPSGMRRPGDTPQLYSSTFDFVAAPGKTLRGVVRDDSPPYQKTGVCIRLSGRRGS